MAGNRIRSFTVPPPGGEYFYELNGERVSDRYWPAMKRKVAALAAKHGMTSVEPEVLVAEYMCKFMPDWFCSGPDVQKTVYLDEAKSHAKDLFGRMVVPFDEVSRRLRICTSCPKHSRPFCITCTGLMKWILISFQGRRVQVPEDTLSGLCGCTRTFEAVVASVDYGDEDRLEGAPDCCWRNAK